MSSSARAELTSAAEAVEGYRQRLATLAAGLSPGREDDLLAALAEAERTLDVAVRSIRRALKVAGSR